MSSDPTPARPGDLLATLGGLAPGRAAEGYAACGFPVVPIHATRPGGGCTCPRGERCPDPGKHPCLADWPRLASTAPAVVRGWWRRWPAANVGLATGVRFDVLDVDGPRGEVGLRGLVVAGAVPRGGPLARTGGGGWHVLLAPTGAGNRVGLRPGLDWRGRGGLIVAPPSRHASGRAYRWVRPLTATLPAVPGGLRRLLAPPPAGPAPLPPPRVPAAGSGRAARYGRAALHAEAAKVRACAPDGHSRQHTLNVAALKLGHKVAAGLLEEAEVWAELASAATATGLAEHEIAKTIGRALADAARQAARGGRQ